MISLLVLRKQRLGMELCLALVAGYQSSVIFGLVFFEEFLGSPFPATLIASSEATVVLADKCTDITVIVLDMLFEQSFGAELSFAATAGKEGVEKLHVALHALFCVQNSSADLAEYALVEAVHMMVEFLLIDKEPIKNSACLKCDMALEVMLKQGFRVKASQALLASKSRLVNILLVLAKKGTAAKLHTALLAGEKRHICKVKYQYDNWIQRSGIVLTISILVLLGGSC
jgi:hypothetical protein